MTKQHSVLLTAHKDLAAPFYALKSVNPDSILHLPLEQFEPFVYAEEDEKVKSQIEQFSFVVHGNLRNARYFIEWMNQNDLKKAVQKLVNLVLDQPTADFLEEAGIPAILPKPESKPIDILEFMLRISRVGSTLYPTTEEKTEEFPGLLAELEMQAAEFTVCRENTVDAEELQLYRDKIQSEKPAAVIFHNRSSVIRIQKAFPDLDLNAITAIAASKGVEQRMRKSGLVPEQTANGSWSSLADVLAEYH